MNPDRRINLSLALLTGLLLGAAFPPVPTGVTAFAGFIPFLLMMRRMNSAAQVFRFSYVAFLVLNLVTVYWISGWWGSDPWLKAAGVAVNLVHPLLFTIPALLLYQVQRRLGWYRMLLVFPFLWAGWEWVAQLPELSFPWLIIGNTQCHSPEKIQFITWTGVYGISFWIASVNAVLVFVATRVYTGAWQIRSRRFAGAAVALILLLLVPELYSRWEIAHAVKGPTLRIGIAQPDIDPYEKWSAGEVPIDKVRGLMSLYDSTVALGRIDAVLMPETAFPFLILQPSYAEEWMEVRHHVESAGVPLLTGFADLRWYDAGTEPASAKKIAGTNERYDTFNSSLLVSPREQRVQVYHKSRLTPLSERVPYLDELPFLQSVLSWGVGISSWGLGNDTTVFQMQNGRIPARIWAMICYETLYPEFVSGFTARGANVLAVITNDGWFGNSSGPYQLEQYAVLRAIESRRSIARCANNGVSCFISPYGDVSNETRFGTRTCIAGDVEVRSDITFYAAYGDVFARACGIVAALFVLASFFIKQRT